MLSWLLKWRLLPDKTLDSIYAETIQKQSKNVNVKQFYFHV